MPFLKRGAPDPPLEADHRRHREISEPFDGGLQLGAEPLRGPVRRADAAVGLAAEAAEEGRPADAAVLLRGVAVEAREERRAARDDPIPAEIDRAVSALVDGLRVVEIAEELLNARVGLRSLVEEPVQRELPVARLEPDVARGDALEIASFGVAAPDADRRIGAVVEVAVRDRRPAELRPRQVVVLDLCGQFDRQIAEVQPAPQAQADAVTAAHFARILRIQARADRLMRLILGWREGRLCNQLQAAVVLGALGDDVDDAQRGVCAVEHRSRTEHDLDVIDELDGNAGRLAVKRGAVALVVGDVPIDEQQDVLAGVIGEQHAARSHFGMAQGVFGDDPERKEVVGLGERADAVAPQILGGDVDRGRRNRGVLLRRLRRRAADGLAEQRIQIRRVRRLGQVLSARRRSTTARSRTESTE